MLSINSEIYEKSLWVDWKFSDKSLSTKLCGFIKHHFTQNPYSDLPKNWWTWLDSSGVKGTVTVLTDFSIVYRCLPPDTLTVLSHQ